MLLRWSSHSLLFYSSTLSLVCMVLRAQADDGDTYTDDINRDDTYPQVVFNEAGGARVSGEEDSDAQDSSDVRESGDDPDDDDYSNNTVHSYPDIQRTRYAVSATTDIHCWMCNSRISDTCTLERCDYWVTYNTSKSPKGFACLRAGYTVDGIPHVYRNCVHTPSTVYDPCEAAILESDNYRVNLTSCEICWDNGCNIAGYKNLWYRNPYQWMEGSYRSNPFMNVSSWPWFLLLFCWTCLLLTCLYWCCMKLFRPVPGPAGAGGGGECCEGADDVIEEGCGDMAEEI